MVQSMQLMKVKCRAYQCVGLVVRVRKLGQTHWHVRQAFWIYQWVLVGLVALVLEVSWSVLWTGVWGWCTAVGRETEPNQHSLWCVDWCSATLGLSGGDLHRQCRHQALATKWDTTIPEYQLRVPGSDEESGQVATCDGRAQYPWCPEEPWETGRPVG